MKKEWVRESFDGNPFLAYQQNLVVDDCEKEQNLLLRKQIIQIFEEKDLEIKNSIWRKQKGFYVDGKVKRTVLMSFGPITFTRTRYKVFNHELDKWKYICLVDGYLQLEKYQKLSLELKQKIINKLSFGARIKNIIDLFPHARLDKSTISRFTRSMDVVDLNKTSTYLNYQIPKNVHENKNIYISVDDAFLTLKEKNKGRSFKVRLGVLHQGVAKYPDERNSKLINKRIIYFIEKVGANTKNQTLKIVNLIQKSIATFYGEGDWNLVVAGDGAKWIPVVADYLNAKIVLDKFHLFKEIYNLFPWKGRRSDSSLRNWNYAAYELVTSAINEYDPEDAISKLIKIAKVHDNKEKVKSIKKVVRYMQNNLPGIKSYAQPWYQGCHTESNVYHFIKSILGTGTKTYNIKTFENILSLRTGYMNTLKPTEIWVHENTINSEDDMMNNMALSDFKEVPEFYKNIDFPILNSKSKTRVQKIKYLIYKN